MELTAITEKAFEAIRENNRLQAEKAYKVFSKNYATGHLYAWSPDGIGCYWYDTLTELKAQHE